jgi:hypothetical protein
MSVQEEIEMELWGLSAALVLGVWRYFFDIDWDLRIKLRRRRRNGGSGRPGP